MSEIISRVNLGGNISPIATSNIFIASSTDGITFTTRAEDPNVTLFNGININVLFQGTPSTSETSYLAVITSSESSAFPIRPAVGNDYATWCANAGAPLINNQQVVNLTFIDGAWIITSATPSRDTKTTYSSKAAASGGKDVSLVTTGEKYTWNNKANGNHTHTTSIAESSGTSQVSLAHGKKYALNAGGTSYIFTMPSDNNTNQTVKGNGTAFGASDAIDIVGGGATTVTADTTNKKITISSTNTTYTDATTSKSGLMSATDKSHLNTLVNLLKDDDTGTTVNTITEVLKVFETYPEGTDIANALALKANTADLAVVATSGKYSDLSGRPSTMKNPSAITIKAGTDTVSSYDGSAAKTFTIAASSTAGAFTISDGTTTKTVQLAGKFTDSNTTYSAAKYNTLGLLKPAYTSTGAATLTTAAASNAETPTIAAKTTTSGRYYAVEADKNGIAYVNVPWSNTTYSAATTSAAGLMSAADKTKLDTISNNYVKEYSTGKNGMPGTIINNGSSIYIDSGNDSINVIGEGDEHGVSISVGDNNFVNFYQDRTEMIDAPVKIKQIQAPTASNGSTYGLGTSGQVLKSNGTSVYWANDNNTTYSLSSFGITATAAELNKLDGVTATATELNYVDGVTSNIQTQLNGKAASSHTHSYSNTVTLTESANGGSGNIQFVKSISGSAPSLGGTTKFVTGYNSFSGGFGSLKSYDAATNGNVKTSSGRIAYVADVSHTAAKLTGTTTFVSAQGTFSAGTLPTATVSNGVLTLTVGTLPSLGAATTASVGISGGSISKTVYYLDHAHTAASLGTASTGTVSISGGSYSATTSYLSKTITSSGTTGTPS